jgi:two-component system chemotaxis sensor kinase CheA
MKKILIVDDSPFFINVLRDLLSEEGFHVSVASSGEAAIELLNAAEASGRYDLLITDLVMPGLSGFDLSLFIRQKNKESKFTPVIVLTEKVITKEEAREHGCAAYIPKSNLNKVVSMCRILLLGVDSQPSSL